MTKQEIWDAAFAEWQRARGMMDAFYDIGPMFRANADWRIARLDAEEKYGSVNNAKADSIGREEIRIAWEAHQHIETRQEEYYEPADEAARQLVRTPAPNLAAILIKIDVAKRHELHFENEMGEEPWDIISAELRAIGGAA